LLSILLALAPAHASAYYFVDAGTRALGRGGAVVAGVDDLSAQYYNNAALVRLDRPQAYLNISGVDQYVRFERKDYDEDGALLTTYDPVENSGPLLVIPSFGVSGSFGLEDTVFAFGFYPPYAPDMEYPADGAQRYTLVDSLVWQTYAGPSVAHRVNDWLSVGAGLVWTLVRAEEELVISTCGNAADPDSTCAESASQEITISLQAWDPARFTGSLGVLVEPRPWLSIGLSGLPPIKVKGKGSLTATFNEEHVFLSQLDGSEFTDEDITLNLTMPMILRGGIAVRPNDRSEIEFASVYQGWHIVDEIVVSDVNLTLSPSPDSTFVTEDIVVTDDVILPAGYQDTFSFRLGGDYDIRPNLTARAGAYFEASAVPAATQGVAVVDGDKFGYGVGGTVRVGSRAAIDFAFSQSFLAKTEITNSEIAQITIPLNLSDLTQTEIADGKIVGNGSFASNLTFGSVGATFYWGKDGGAD
jgi:long-chain fatty acid transport protein